jgi:hypothetical protein
MCTIYNLYDLYHQFAFTQCEHFKTLHMKFIKDDNWIYLFQKWWKLMTTIKGYVIFR